MISCIGKEKNVSVLTTRRKTPDVYIWEGGKKALPPPNENHCSPETISQRLPQKKKDATLFHLRYVTKRRNT